MFKSALLVARASLAAVLLAIAAQPAMAFSCGDTARSPVLRALCASAPLRTLDARRAALTRQLAEAHPAQKTDLMRDDANWQAETRHEALQTLRLNKRYPHLKTALAKALGPRYRARAAYLEARLHPPALGPVIKTVRDALTTKDSALQETSKLLAANPQITLFPARPVTADVANDAADAIDPAALLQGLGLTPDSALGKHLRNDFSPDNAFERVWIPAADVGVIEQWSGTAICLDSDWFVAKNAGRATSMPPPSIFDGPRADCQIEADVARIDGHTVVLSAATPDVDQRTVRLQVLGSRGWNKPVTIVIRYDHELGSALVVHRPDSGDGFWKSLAGPTAQAFDRHPVPGFAEAALSPSDFRRLRHIARQVNRKNRQQDYIAAPAAGSARNNPIYPYGSFDPTNAVYFAQAASGHWLLGLIGHPHAGWRTQWGWLIGYWTDDANGNLVPLATVDVPASPTRILGTAVLVGASSQLAE